MFIYNAGWIPQVDEDGNLVQETSNVDESTRYLAFLTEAYKPRAYWFVVPENTRRLMLSSALIVFLTSLVSLVRTSAVRSASCFTDSSKNSCTPGVPLFVIWSPRS